MKPRKQFIIALVCIIALCAVFLGVSYFGNNLTAFMGNTKDVSLEDKEKENPDADANKPATKDDKTEKTSGEKSEKDNKDQKNSEDKSESQQTSQETKEGYYTVKSNDTLYSIARTYMPDHNTAEVVANIRERNNLKDTDPIITGQKLIISYETKLVNSDSNKDATNKEENKDDKKPTDDQNKTTGSLDHSKHVKYTVKSGDTLFSIAGQYFKDMNVVDAVNKIKADNSLTSDVIKIDQTLCIPVEQ